MTEIKYFEYDRSRLTKSENQVLDYLSEVGELIHQIWAKQIGDADGISAFYPIDASKKELAEAANKDEQILAPYTIVVREGGQLKAIPYRTQYSAEIVKIVELLRKAADEIEEEKGADYLRKLADAYEDGDFDRALVEFLTNEMPKIEILAGPIETYEDKLMGVKKSFQFSLRVMKSDATKEVLQMTDVMRQIQILRPKGSVSANVDIENIRVRVDDVLMFSGRQAGVLVSSTNLPNETELVEQYGAKIVVYTTSMFEKFDKKLRPLLPKVKDLKLEERVDDMKSATFRLVALHEIAEAVVKFPSMKKRLGSSHDFIRELNADIMGVHSAKYHVLNGTIDAQQYKDLLMSFLIFAIDICNRYEEGASMLEYAKGFAVVFNFFFNTGALQVENGLLIVDFVKLSRDIEVISNHILEIMESGEEADAEALLEEYGDFNIFEKLPRP